MKHILAGLIFFLPFHAFLVTVLKCKYHINTDLLRFWKEGVVLGLLIFVFFRVYKNHQWSLKKIYDKNTLVGLTTAFILCSVAYIFLPFLTIKTASLLGFRYDVFFFFTMLIGLYSGLMGDLRYLLRTLFVATFGILIIFLPWYLFGDISLLASKLGYSAEVSTYQANSCISFAQNVEGQHRFQGTFGGPIRFSVFLTVVLSLFSGWILSSERFSNKKRYFMLGGFAALCVLAIFFSYSKTSILGLIFAGSLFAFLSYKYVYKRKITKQFYLWVSGILATPILAVAIIHAELFLHIGAMVNRLDNIGKSIQMFFYNPFGYGLGIAGPASQIGDSIESAGSWGIAVGTVQTVHKFLPENWYVQILLEQGIIGFSLFAALMILIGYRLIITLKQRADFLSVGITTSYFALCFMALFTHAFEEAATSYILFLCIGIVLSESMIRERTGK